MSDIVETAPRAVPRDRRVEARRAARQAKASRERRIIESLTRGVSVAEIAEREDVGEKRMRAGSRHSHSAHARTAGPVPRVAGEPSRGGAPRVLRRHVAVQPSGCRSRHQDRARVRSLSRFRRGRAAEPPRSVRSARGNCPMARTHIAQAESPANGAAKA